MELKIIGLGSFNKVNFKIYKDSSESNLVNFAHKFKKYFLLLCI
ncbi:hypothetical protein ADIWIN_3986 [Winogradskyella psychrotolerans RS-3]|uniref:Uncharacterized protein n=1 Tax=Winogradskyella psychrotolerans RS-3 TaxID=641526 RepID=S7VID1_9FLAO|nr:hypothetical protein ADIWIN_3986 [Winogradskyella psychrotolerans RS-3]